MVEEYLTLLSIKEIMVGSSCSSMVCQFGGWHPWVVRRNEAIDETTSLLETRDDIIFFWVSCMVILGEKLTREAFPFNQVT